MKDACQYLSRSDSKIWLMGKLLDSKEDVHKKPKTKQE